MRVSQKTRSIVDDARRDAHQAISVLDRIYRQLSELPGVGKEAKKVKKIIEVSDFFIRGR